MKARKVLVITHGHFGIELVKSVEMIMGKQDFIDAMGLVPGQSVDDLRQQTFDVLAKNERRRSSHVTSSGEAPATSLSPVWAKAIVRLSWA